MDCCLRSRQGYIASRRSRLLCSLRNLLATDPLTCPTEQLGSFQVAVPILTVQWGKSPETKPGIESVIVDKYSSVLNRHFAFFIVCHSFPSPPIMRKKRLNKMFISPEQ